MTTAGLHVIFQINSNNVSRLGNEVLVQTDSLYKHFNVSGGILDQISFKEGKPRRTIELVKALNGVNLKIKHGEVFCLVGESGCGKTTVGRTIIGLLSPSSGAVYYRNNIIDNLKRNQLLPYRRKMQMIFQNTYESLNPRKTVTATLLEPIQFHKPELTLKEQKEKVLEVMNSVGIDISWGTRFPHEFSGGQRQRISIARALMVDPEFIIADEPISALDVSVQAQVLNLLGEERVQRGLTYLFITHDLSVVEHFGTRVAVMYLGRICELGETKEIFSMPRHPYTQALLSAIPKLGQSKSRHIKIEGEVPTAIELPPGCVFHSRCPHARDICKSVVPELESQGSQVQVACHGIRENWI